LFDFDDDITPAEARLAHDYVFGFLDYPDTGTDDYFREGLKLIRTVNQSQMPHNAPAGLVLPVTVVKDAIPHT
jgi:hypothetical protein